MARKHVIVKRQSAIDDLGSMDVFCSDKTGTLTEARIKLIREVDLIGQASSEVMQLALLNAAFETGLKSPLDEAILTAGPVDLTVWRKIDEVPFDFQRRRVSILCEGDGRRLIIVKGAPEDVLNLSTRYQQTGMPPRPLDTEARKTAEATFNALGVEGFRVLAVAWRQVDHGCQNASVTDEADLTFAGFLAFLDPPKAGAREAMPGHLLIVAGHDFHVDAKIGEFGKRRNAAMMSDFCGGVTRQNSVVSSTLAASASSVRSATSGPDNTPVTRKPSSPQTARVTSSATLAMASMTRRRFTSPTLAFP
jgi:magnesium-transporting ATPase (P-type)